jgi:hypothetical protein
LESDAAVYKQVLLRSRKGPTMKASAPIAIVIAALLFSGPFKGIPGSTGR